MKIVNRTYKNFLHIYNQMLKKGYASGEAWVLADKCFANHEANPEGMSIQQYANLVLPKSKWCTEYNLN